MNIVKFSKTESGFVSDGGKVVACIIEDMCKVKTPIGEYDLKRSGKRLNYTGKAGNHSLSFNPKTAQLRWA